MVSSVEMETRVVNFLLVSMAVVHSQRLFAAVIDYIAVLMDIPVMSQWQLAGKEAKVYL